MDEIYGIKQILGQMVQTLDLMSDELAELVDQFHRPRMAKDNQREAVDRSLAVVSAAKELRQVAETFLEETYLPRVLKEGESQ